MSSEEADQILVNSILNSMQKDKVTKDIPSKETKDNIQDKYNGIIEEKWMMSFTINRYPNGKSFQSQPKMWMQGAKRKVSKPKPKKSKSGQTKILEEENY